MQTKPQIEATGRRRSAPAMLLSVVRGDKYMAAAYPAVAPRGAVSSAPSTKKRSVMRDRHLPRLCRRCQAPTARQEAACWRCGTQWASEGGPRTDLTVIAGAAAEQGLDAERWIDEGGAVVSETSDSAPAAAAG